MANKEVVDDLSRHSGVNVTIDTALIRARSHGNLGVVHCFVLRRVAEVGCEYPG